jgi:hypothetical protein
VADKIPATGKWEGRSKGHSREPMVKFKGGTMASPERASEIMTERRRNRATREHQKEHPDKLVRNDLLVGSRNRLRKKYESDEKKEEHIQKRMDDSKRKKPAENQK